MEWVQSDVNPMGGPYSWEVGEADSTAPFWLHVYVGYHKFYSWCNEDVPWFMLARQHRPLSRNFICSVATFQERYWNVFPAMMPWRHWRCNRYEPMIQALASTKAAHTTVHMCTGRPLKPVCIATVQGQQHYCSDYLGCVHMKGTSNFLLSFSNNFRLLVTARLMHRL